MIEQFQQHMITKLAPYALYRRFVRTHQQGSLFLRRVGQQVGLHRVVQLLRHGFGVRLPWAFHQQARQQAICAQMKTRIDRCLAVYMAISGKTFYLIVTAAEPLHSAADTTLADFRGFLRCLPGAKEAGVVLGTGTWDKGDVYRHPSMKQAYEMGKGI